MLAVPVPEVIDHIPPDVTSVKAGVVEFTHTLVAPPAIAATVGKAFTVNITPVLLELTHPVVVFLVCA